MEKDRTRRYASASELAADLQRHIADEPVLARPTGVGYRAQKFVKRHRAAVAGAVAGLLLLAAFGVAMAVQSARIAAERDAAAHERDRAEAVLAFMTSLFEASDPNRSKGEKVSARQLLDQGRQRLERELVDQPQTRAALLHTIGRVYRILEVDDAAESAIREALKIRKSATGKDRAGYADSLYELGRLNIRAERSETWTTRSFAFVARCSGPSIPKSPRPWAHSHRTIEDRARSPKASATTKMPSLWPAE